MITLGKKGDTEYIEAANECGADKRNKRNELIRCFGLAFYENRDVGGGVNGDGDSEWGKKWITL